MYEHQSLDSNHTKTQQLESKLLQIKHSIAPQKVTKGFYVVVRIFLKALKPISFVKYSYSATICTPKNYLDQHSFYKWRYPEFENFAVYVEEKFQDSRKAHFFIGKFKKFTKSF